MELKDGSWLWTQQKGSQSNLSRPEGSERGFSMLRKLAQYLIGKNKLQRH
jgi:hypothetical protein